MKKDRTENIQKTYKKCAPYGNCTEIVQKIYKKCAKFCNSSLVETGSLFELLQILAHFLYIFCTISVQFPYGAHFLYVFCMFSYVFCMFSVRSFFIGKTSLINSRINAPVNSALELKILTLPDFGQTCTRILLVKTIAILAISLSYLTYWIGKGAISLMRSSATKISARQARLTNFLSPILIENL